MNILNKFLPRGFATCLMCGWETPLTRSFVIEGYYFRIARLLYLVHRVTKHYPSQGFIYWWREYGFKIALGQVTGKHDPIESKGEQK
ncbi:hypothetical protein UFOVP222_111 [uncultured Caudovirales phage]|uniref:Uncharacterized protein n=1 Tax=uncultured Caudovirales phage TaxID=2100421 RepID=A0A6J7WPI4_9CAUD|nr:hypothetical protein UFOVP108_106 [uncultured Caudovirales phage]CAB5219680.1 hypothetical protein UFOVP222_111 [uncultured Caudovirales phage]